MLISALAAIVMFAAPEASQSGEASKMAAEAKPEMKKVCETIQVSGSNLPKKKCRNVPVKAAAKPGEDATDKAPTKPE